jgi:hypothetical protein
MRNEIKKPLCKVQIYTAGEKDYEELLVRKDKGVPFTEELLKKFSGLCADYGLEEYLAYFKI